MIEKFKTALDSIEQIRAMLIETKHLIEEKLVPHDSETYLLFKSLELNFLLTKQNIDRIIQFEEDIDMFDHDLLLDTGDQIYQFNKSLL